MSSSSCFEPRPGRRFFACRPEASGRRQIACTLVKVVVLPVSLPTRPVRSDSARRCRGASLSCRGSRASRALSPFDGRISRDSAQADVHCAQCSGVRSRSVIHRRSQRTRPSERATSSVRGMSPKRCMRLARLRHVGTPSAGPATGHHRHQRRHGVRFLRARTIRRRLQRRVRGVAVRNAAQGDRSFTFHRWERT